MAHLGEACESKTINYITHTLPQQCHRLAWSAQTLTHSSAPPIQSTALKTPEQTSPRNAVSVTDESSGRDMTTTMFPSFEEFKEMMLRKQSQDPSEVHSHKDQEERPDKYGSGDELEIPGDDGEIDMNFDALADKLSEKTGHTQGTPQDQTRDGQHRATSPEDPNATPVVRSKDAGKTCKERFSYSSFDAGATILRTSPDAKNAKAILVETKDTYMLLECSEPNKFIVIEMSDDILVDTVVVANFEFFSSMIHHFQVSVSDRYPVKSDKWKVLGTFEARNSRDIQAFLVEHPLIWAKYIKIEFLTHYGNEYYCPISLVRVHGTRMLEAWNDADPGSQEDDQDEDEVISAAPVDHAAQDTTKEDAAPPQHAVSDICFSHEDIASPAARFRRAISDVCPLAATTAGHNRAPSSRTETRASQIAVAPEVVDARDQAGPHELGSARDSKSWPTASPTAVTSAPPTASVQLPESGKGSSYPPVSSQSSVAGSSSASAKSKASATLRGTPTSTRDKTTTSVGPASPTVQESFFKTITKRLTQLESNNTLSLQYIESQSRFLQQTLKSMELNQVVRVNSFLNQLNGTVLSELDGVKEQYDQMWQSTVLALETQREQSVRELFALSQRMEVLADEVVFQRRMAMVQSVLLLVCLGLVIFGRNATGGTSMSSIGTFLENPRTTWLSSMGSPARLTGPQFPTQLDYQPGASAPIKKLLERYRAADGRPPESVRMTTPTTPTAESGEEESPGTPRTVNDHIISGRRSDLSACMNSPPDIDTVVPSTEPGLDLGQEPEKHAGHSTRENTASSDHSSQALSVFGRGSTETSLYSDVNSINSPRLSPNLNPSIDHSRCIRASASGLELKPTPAPPDDVSSTVRNNNK